LQRRPILMRTDSCTSTSELPEAISERRGRCNYRKIPITFKIPFKIAEGANRRRTLVLWPVAVEKLNLSKLVEKTLR
jgi:hypothetical protein